MFSVTILHRLLLSCKGVGGAQRFCLIFLFAAVCPHNTQTLIVFVGVLGPGDILANFYKQISAYDMNEANKKSMRSASFALHAVYLHANKACSNVIGQHYSDYKRTTNAHQNASDTKTLSHCLQISAFRCRYLFVEIRSTVTATFCSQYRFS